jgi:hypothetical protein
MIRVNFSLIVVIAFCFLCTSELRAADWRYSWNTRTDHHNLPAGILGQTPFPIDENTESYLMKSDESPEGREYHLGTKYFVDGKDGSDSNDGLSLAAAKQTLQAAINTAGSGNKTILVRGAHDGWNGAYEIDQGISLYGISGIDDTHRFTIVGYGQERPIIDGGQRNIKIFGRSNSTDAFITIQRFKLQRADYGIRLGWDVAGDKRDAFVNSIDVWLTSFKYSTIYHLNSDHGFTSHCLAEYTYGHGFKLGDGASKHILEWSVARNIGYWDGLDPVNNPVRPNMRNSAVGFDFPVDNNERDADSITLRYSIAHDVVNYGLQLRRVRDFKAHHNEFYNCVHFDELPPTGGNIGRFTVIFYAGQVGGEFYSNIVRNPSSADTSHLYFGSSGDNPNGVKVYNNLIYGSTGPAITIGTESALKISFKNNSVYADSANPLIYCRSSQKEDVILSSNIFYQAGTGVCYDWSWGAGDLTHIYNQYYLPQTTLGADLSEGEVSEDPEWLAVPQNAFNPRFCRLTKSLPGQNQSSEFSVDFWGNLRTGWDRGAIDYSSPDGVPPLPPSGLRVSGS